MGPIQGIAHINLTIPAGTLDDARAFYGTTLGMTSVPVPELQRGTLLWFDITPGGQQMHISFGQTPDPKSLNHPCFKLGSAEQLEELKMAIWNHFESKEVNVKGSPLEADRPGGENSGAKGVEYPTRFFARDYAGNRLEFSL